MAQRLSQVPDLVSAEDLDIFISELQKTPSREVFNSAMRRFEESYMHRFKAAEPVERGKFPFGVASVSVPVVPQPQLSQPYSFLGSFYHGETNRLPPMEPPRRYEELYTAPMHERGVRSESPVNYVRTEYVPYPYPLHPPYEYSYAHPAASSQSHFRKNPLQESMDLRRVKEEMFNSSLHFNDPGRSQTPNMQTRFDDNREPYRSSYARK